MFCFFTQVFENTLKKVTGGVVNLFTECEETNSVNGQEARHTEFNRGLSSIKESIVGSFEKVTNGIANFFTNSEATDFTNIQPDTTNIVGPVNLEAIKQLKNGFRHFTPIGNMDEEQLKKLQFQSLQREGLVPCKNHIKANQPLGYTIKQLEENSCSTKGKETSDFLNSIIELYKHETETGYKNYVEEIYNEMIEGSSSEEERETIEYYFKKAEELHNASNTPEPLCTTNGNTIY